MTSARSGLLVQFDTTHRLGVSYLKHVYRKNTLRREGKCCLWGTRVVEKLAHTVAGIQRRREWGVRASVTLVAWFLGDSQFAVGLFVPHASAALKDGAPRSVRCGLRERLACGYGNHDTGHEVGDACGNTVGGCVGELASAGECAGEY
mgnify:CR=1 FL=1